jgi:type IV secretory pathway VirB10-like protein
MTSKKRATLSLKEARKSKKSTKQVCACMDGLACGIWQLLCWSCCPYLGLCLFVVLQAVPHDSQTGQGQDSADRELLAALMDAPPGAVISITKDEAPPAAAADAQGADQQAAAGATPAAAEDPPAAASDAADAMQLAAGEEAAAAAAEAPEPDAAAEQEQQETAAGTCSDQTLMPQAAAAAAAASPTVQCTGMLLLV